MIDWGDGTAPERIALVAGVSTFSGAHQYLDDNPTATAADTANIRVRVQDDTVDVLAAKPASDLLNRYDGSTLADFGVLPATGARAVRRRRSAGPSSGSVQRTAQAARHAYNRENVSAHYADSWLERKPLGLAMHYRQVGTEQIPELLAASHSTLDSFASTLRIVQGPMAVEITPELGWTKGTAVRIVCKQLGRDVLPLYAGDHANDAEAMAAAVAMGGIALAIGPDAPCSAAYVPLDRAALLPFLSRFLETATRNHESASLTLSR